MGYQQANSGVVFEVWTTDRFEPQVFLDMIHTDVDDIQDKSNT